MVQIQIISSFCTEKESKVLVSVPETHGTILGTLLVPVSSSGYPYYHNFKNKRFAWAGGYEIIEIILPIYTGFVLAELQLATKIDPRP